MAGSPFRLFWRYDSDSGTFTASSVASGYDVDNLKLGTLDKKWMSDTDTSHTVTVDLGSAQSITAFVALDHDFLVGDTIVLRYASNSGFSAGVGTINPTWYDGTLVEFFSAVSRRYWRLEVDGASGTRQLGRLLLGTHYEMERNIRVGYRVGPGQDTGKTVRTQGGQLYGDIGVRLKVLTGEFTAHQDADEEEISELQDTNGMSVPLFVAMDWESEPLKKSLYGTMMQIGPPINIAGDKWSFPLSMVEQK